MGKRYRRAYLAVVLMWVGGSALAHNDGDDTADGHYYGVNPYGAQRWARAQDAADYWDTQSANYACGTVGWELSGAKRWAFLQSSVEACPTSGYQPFEENHCPVGTVVNETSDSCVAATSGPCYGDELSYTAVGNPNFANGEGCLYRRTASVVNSENGACYDVTYTGTGWGESDTTGFAANGGLGSAQTAFAGQSDVTLTGIGDLPSSCGGGIDPFDPGGIGEEDRCPVTDPPTFVRRYMADWGAGTPPSTMCSATGCRMVVSCDSLCICVGARCGVLGANTGALCDGTEDGSEGDGTSTVGGGGTSDGEQLAALERIYGRLGTMSNRQVEGDAAIVAGLAVLNDTLEDAGTGAGGGGECEGDSCSEDVPTLGVSDSVEVSTQGFIDRVAAAPLIAAIDGLGGSIPVAACPSFSSDPIEQLNNTTLTITAQCDLWEDISPVLSAVMLIIYTVSGAFIILRA